MPDLLELAAGLGDDAAGGSGRGGGGVVPWLALCLNRTEEDWGWRLYASV